MNRIHAKDAVELEDGCKCKLGGWLQETKKLGGIAFLKIRDRTGVFQVVLSEDEIGEETFQEAIEIPRESVVMIEGEKKATDQTELGFEIVPISIKVESEAEKPLPLGVVDKVDAEMGTRFDNRFLDLRKEEKRLIFEIRDILLDGLRDFFNQEDFIEINTPKIVAAGAEGGATLFELDYYGEEAYLAQSPQLYKQMLMASGFERVYEIAPAYRAEDFATVRHTSEFLSLDFEMSFIEGSADIMDMTSYMIKHTLSYVKEHGKKKLDRLGVELEIPSHPFKKVPYRECIAILQEMGREWEEEPEIGTEEEKVLGNYIKEEFGTDFFFITEFPTRVKEGTFYAMRKEYDPSLTTYFDLEYKGQELVSGGQREHRYEILVDQMEEIGIDLGDFSSYLEPFKYGMPTHGGIGLGVDRLLQQLLNLDNVREGILFPRDPRRLEP
ncbi:MAG: aspartate--tRNA(Asn) ligase [Candidatus Thermoplasmatota archaeon]|nr:aspartate--tRNA(Asn) ligase [Candidatus Thermoplasmatota archaeon]MBS3789341.1 aspartate--tRNA(Asn) ligase [Candidatus Thermoplasmatota archaeon]